jgi:hypothetical protein
MGLVAVSTILLVVGVVVIGWMLKRLGEAGPPSVPYAGMPLEHKKLLVHTLISSRCIESVGHNEFVSFDDSCTADTISGSIWKDDGRIEFVATVDDEGFVTIPKWIVPNENGPADVFQFDDLARALDCAESKGRVKDAA